MQVNQSSRRTGRTNRVLLMMLLRVSQTLSQPETIYHVALYAKQAKVYAMRFLKLANLIFGEDPSCDWDPQQRLASIGEKKIYFVGKEELNKQVSQGQAQGSPMFFDHLID